MQTVITLPQLGGGKIKTGYAEGGAARPTTEQYRNAVITHDTISTRTIPRACMRRPAAAALAPVRGPFYVSNCGEDAAVQPIVAVKRPNRTALHLSQAYR